jgi:hypothetical protein
MKITQNISMRIVVILIQLSDQLRLISNKLYDSLTRWPGHLATTQTMHVNMKNALATMAITIHHKSITLLSKSTLFGNL